MATDPLQQAEALARASAESGGTIRDEASSTSFVDPETLVRETEARKKLRQLELNEVADLIPLFQKLMDRTMKQMEDVIQALRDVLAELLKLHDLMMKDAEFQLQVTRTFQSVIVIEEPDPGSNVQKGRVEKPTRR